MEKNKVKKSLVNKLKEGFEGAANQVGTPNITPGAELAAKSKPKETVVKFDKSTNPFDVKFSERGFEISETRFSFEFLENALSKDVNIVLNKGNGLVLDSIKMEKILKYKDLYA
jgi:hypothetical protein